MAGKAEWHTPVCVQKHKEILISKLEKSERDETIELTPELTYFNNPVTHMGKTEYDLFFAYTKTFPLYDQRKIRDNRQYLPDIHENIFQQEKHKAVPVLTSHNYGRPCRKFYDFAEKGFNRQRTISNFYRRRGVMRVKEKEPQ